MLGLNKIMEYLGKEPGHVIYELHEPVDIKVKRVENGYIGECEKLGLIGSGESLEELDVDINKEFVFLYERLMDIDNRFLSNRMKDLKKEFKRVVKNRSLKWM